MRLILLLLLSTATAALAQPKLYLFDCGVLQLDDVSSFGLSNDVTDVRELFVPCYIIEHPKGRLLWDGGLPLAVVGQGVVEIEGGAMGYQTSVLDQMAAMDLTPADIDYIAFSHMHFDHVGAAQAFTKSTLLIQQTEYAAAFDSGADNPYFDTSLYAGLAANERIILDGDHDVFGDGTVTIVSAPGHTPGHQVLALKLANFGPLVLSGDLYHFVKSRELMSVPEFNTDADQTKVSMARVEKLIEQLGATLWIEHNMALAKTLKLAPAYYD